MLVCQFDEFEIRLLQHEDVAALKGLEPGDLACSRGEWIVASGKEEQFVGEALHAFAEQNSLEGGIWKGDELVGLIGLHNMHALRKSAGLDYGMDARFRRQGIMTQACRAMITYAFERLKLNRTQITPDVENEPSCRIPETLGFIKEGIMRDFYRLPEGFRDVAVYSMLKREWNG